MGEGPPFIFSWGWLAMLFSKLRNEQTLVGHVWIPYKSINNWGIREIHLNCKQTADFFRKCNQIPCVLFKKCVQTGNMSKYVKTKSPHKVKWVFFKICKNPKKTKCPHKVIWVMYSSGKDITTTYSLNSNMMINRNTITPYLLSLDISTAYLHFRSL